MLLYVTKKWVVYVISLDMDAIRSSYELNNREDYRVLNHAYAFNSWYNAEKKDDFLEIVANETALLLSIDFHADINTIVAALIHNTVREKGIDDGELCEEFNEDVMYKVNLLNRFSVNPLEETKNDKEVMIRSILLDVKVPIIKLVERIAILHNAENIPYTKICNFLKDTFEFYVPISQLLGIYKIKNNLEDLCFRYDSKYEKANRVVQKTIDRYDNIISIIEKKFDKFDISFKEDISFKSDRKSSYDICKKTGEFSQFCDVLNNEKDLKLSGFCSAKCLTKTKEECYAMLCFLHSFKYRAASFCDYISDFQGDEYKALHTQVFVKDYLVDFHICTKEMDRVNLYGVTSDWKVDDNLQGRLMERYAFYRKLQELTYDDNIDLVDEFMTKIAAKKLDPKKCMELEKIKSI